MIGDTFRSYGGTAKRYAVEIFSTPKPKGTKMKITRGATRPNGLRIVIYGPEGIGKTSLAAKLPDNLFLDYENGTHGMDVNKVTDVPATFASVNGAIAELKRDHQGFRYVTIDTADKFEDVLASSYSEQKKVDDIFAVNDYGRTVSAFRSEMATVLDSLSGLAASGMNVVLLAHAMQRKAEPLEGDGTYDVTELKLSKTVTPLVKEWADVIIFVAYKTFVVKTDERREKVSGGKRWCFTVHTNEWTAKHRVCINLPDDCSLDKMAEILPKAVSEATAADRMVVDAPSASVTAEVHAPIETSAPAPATDDTPMVVEFRRILANYGLGEKQIRGYAATHPKLKARYGDEFSFNDAPLSKWPEEAVEWLIRGMARIAEKIRS